MELVLEELCIRKQGHEHLVQDVVFFEQVFIREFYFSVLWQLFLTVQQDVFAEKVLQDLVFFFELLDRQVDWDDWSLQAFQKVLFGVCLFGCLGNCPQEVFIAQSVNFLQREGNLHLFIDFDDSILHFFLFSLLLLQLFFHLFVSIFGLLDFCLKACCDLLFLLLDLLQLIVELCKTFLEVLYLLILSSTEFCLKILDLASYFFFAGSQHLLPYVQKGPSDVLSLDFLQIPHHSLAYFYELYDDPCVLDSIEMLLYFSIMNLDDLPQSRSIVSIDLELLEVSELFDFLQDEVQIFAFFAKEKSCYQSNGSSSLFLQGLLQMCDLFRLTCQGSPLHFLEGLPLGKVILLSEHIFNSTLHPLFELEPPKRNDLESLPDVTHLIDVQSVCHQSQCPHLAVHLLMQELGLKRDLGLLLRHEFGRQGGIGFAHYLGINIKMGCNIS